MPIVGKKLLDKLVFEVKRHPHTGNILVDQTKISPKFCHTTTPVWISYWLSPMALVSDRSLADLCLELNQPPSTISLSLSSPEAASVGNHEKNQENSTERISESSLDSSHSSSDDPSTSFLNLIEHHENHENGQTDQVPETAPDFQMMVENEVEEEEEEEEAGKCLSLAEFRKQSEELTSYLDNFKAMKLERERQEEVSQHQTFQDEKIAAFTELDNMVSFINNVKTTFTPPEKEKPIKKEREATGSGGKKFSPHSAVAAPLVGKGKYASRGRLNFQNSDDYDSTLTTVSTSQSHYSPRGQEEDDSLLSEHEFASGAGAGAGARDMHYNRNGNSKKSHQHHSDEEEEEEEENDGQHSEHTSGSDESEVTPHPTLCTVFPSLSSR
jgi:hypothetical protein